MVNNFVPWIISVGMAGFVAERILEVYSSHRKEIGYLRLEYKNEFGMDPPEYLLLRELRDQIHARKEMRR